MTGDVFEFVGREYQVFHAQTDAEDRKIILSIVELACDVNDELCSFTVTAFHALIDVTARQQDAVNLRHESLVIFPIASNPNRHNTRTTRLSPLHIRRSDKRVKLPWIHDVEGLRDFLRENADDGSVVGNRCRN